MSRTLRMLASPFLPASKACRMWQGDRILRKELKYTITSIDILMIRSSKVLASHHRVHLRCRPTPVFVSFQLC